MAVTNAVAVLASGGLDSAILVAQLAIEGREVTPIYVRFGLAWEDVEARHLERFLASLEECELMIEGIGRDKISDLTTNVIRTHLIEYTQDQCTLHGVPLQNVAVAPCFDPTSNPSQPSLRMQPDKESP